jgi:hypothetical protein
MELTDQMIASIVSYGQAAARRTPQDARKTPRFSWSACISMATVRDGAIDPLTTALAVDISRAGISLMSSLEFELGQEFVVWLPTASDACLAVYCKTAWRDQINRSSCLIGGSYTRMGTEQESAMRRIPQPPSADSASEHCTFPDESREVA